MVKQIAFNLVLAVIWMAISNDRSIAGFVVGYVIGLFFLFMLRRFMPGPFYGRRIWAVIALIALFLKELVLSNVAVLIQILRPRLRVSPGVFAYETELKSDWEITLLASLITLTPGTLTLEVSENQEVLYIHALDISDAEEMKRQIRGSFERAIREVTR